MSRAVSLSQLRKIPYALSLAFACAWMIDPSLAAPDALQALIPFARYPHLLATAITFAFIAIAHQQVGQITAKRPILATACLLCLLCFALALVLKHQESDVLFLPISFCLLMVVLCQALLLLTCLKAFANLSMVDCMLALIAWQLFVAILRCIESICPSGAISLIAPLIIVLCFARKSTVYLLQRNLVIAEETDTGANSISKDLRQPAKLIAMNTIVVFTIQSLQGLSYVSVASVSYLGLLIAIVVTSIVLAINKRIIRIGQLCFSSICLIELGVVVFSLSTAHSFELASIVLDAAYMAFSTYFFVSLCNFCQRSKMDPILMFAMAYLFEQLSAFLADALTLALGPGVHVFFLVVLAGFGTLTLILLSDEDDCHFLRSSVLDKEKCLDPIRYFATLTDTCSSVSMQYSLSRRESDVLLLLAQKKTAPQISADLVVSLATAKTHIHNIYKKIGVHSRQELYDFLGLS